MSLVIMPVIAVVVFFHADVRKCIALEILEPEGEHQAVARLNSHVEYIASFI